MGTGHLQARAGLPAFVDGVTQLNGGKGKGRSLVLQRGEARIQVRLGVVQTNICGAGIVGLLFLEEVHVAVDQSREDRGAAEIDDSGALRNLHLVGGPNVGNAIPLDDDDLIRKHLSGSRVEQVASANGHALRRRILRLHFRGIEWAGLRTYVHGLGLRRDGSAQNPNRREKQESLGHERFRFKHGVLRIIHISAISVR